MDENHVNVIVIPEKGLVKLAKTYRRRGFVAGFLFSSVGPIVIKTLAHTLDDKVNKLGNRVSKLKDVIETTGTSKDD